MEKTTEFQWTDELVNEMVYQYCKLYIPRGELNWAQAIEKFKQSKVKKEEPVVRPPLGLKPFKIHTEHRLNDIYAAITRYQEVNKEIPKEWIAEMQTLEGTIKSYSKEEPKQWEILEFEHSSGKATFTMVDDGGYRCDNFPGERFSIDDLLNNKIGKTYIIKKVKRLSDGEVFSIGDLVEYCLSQTDKGTEFYMGEIKELSLRGDNRIWASGEPFQFSIPLKALTKISKSNLQSATNAKPEEPLPIKVLDINDYGTDEAHLEDNRCYYEFITTPNARAMEKIPQLKKAIESVLNDSSDVLLPNDIKIELRNIQKYFTDKVNEYRAANFIDGEGLTLLNLSDKNEIKIGFAIDYYKLKTQSLNK